LAQDLLAAIIGSSFQQAHLERTVEVSTLPSISAWSAERDSGPIRNK